MRSLPVFKLLEKKKMNIIDGGLKMFVIYLILIHLFI